MEHTAEATLMAVTSVPHWFHVATAVVVALVVVLAVSVAVAAAVV